MTFVEAAIEILKREGKPLSSRRLAELAVKLNLLSVVGRDPESTMQERLEDAMESIARHPDLVRLKPDTFGLHAYPPQPYPANGTQAHAQPVEGGAEAAAAEPKKGRRRRGRGGRPADAVEGAAPAPADAAAEGDEEGAEAEEGEAAATDVAAAGEAGAPAEGKRRRRRR
ncbi:MAG: winged helix-turn-helix domain-containing protein, partial [Polyangia bacterium]